MSSRRKVVDETAEEFPILTQYDGLMLSGVIMPPANPYLRVRLDNPAEYAGVKDDTARCFAQACAYNGFEVKHQVGYVYTYTPRALARAHRMLKDIYNSIRMRNHGLVG